MCVCVKYLSRLRKLSLREHMLVFRQLDPPFSLVAVGDSAYAAGGFEALALRGGFVLLMSRSSETLGGKASILD